LHSRAGSGILDCSKKYIRNPIMSCHTAIIYCEFFIEFIEIEIHGQFVYVVSFIQ